MLDMDGYSNKRDSFKCFVTIGSSLYYRSKVLLWQRSAYNFKKETYICYLERVIKFFHWLDQCPGLQLTQWEWIISSQHYLVLSGKWMFYLELIWNNICCLSKHPDLWWGCEALSISCWITIINEGSLFQWCQSAAWGRLDHAPGSRCRKNPGTSSGWSCCPLHTGQAGPCGRAQFYRPWRERSLLKPDYKKEKSPSKSDYFLNQP